jgi:hypothetical protein
MEAVGVHVPVLESYNSALDTIAPALSAPPATKTFPFVSNVAVERVRPTLMLPVAVHVPGVCVVAVATGVWSADLLNGAKVSRTPIEQRTKPIKTRGLKKADREKELFSIAITSSCASEP